MATDQTFGEQRSNLSKRKGLHFEALEPRILFDASAGSAPTAEVSVSTGDLTTNQDQFVNDNIEFNISFDNNGGQEGYVPYVDFLAEPEMEIQSVSAFGGALSNSEGDGADPIGMVSLTGELVDIATGNPINHPQYSTSIGSPSSDYFGGAGSGSDPVTFDPSFAGYYVYSVQLPFGSFTPGNPPADIVVEASLDDADNVEANRTYELHARGGFSLGCDPLDNPGTIASVDDAPVFGAFSSSSVYPVVMDLVKTASTAEEDGAYTGENVSGPNHPVTYRLEIDIADGETINNLNLTDVLPDDLAYLGGLSVTDGSGGAISFVTNGEPQLSTDDINGVSAADNTLDITFPSVTGGAGVDIIVTYEAFVPYVEEGGDLIVDENSGEEGDLDEYNDAQIVGDWTNNAGATIQVSDNAGPANGGDPDGVLADRETDYQIEEHSLAIQKGVDFADGGGDRAATGWSEGDVAEFTMNFQISDYFAFGSLLVTDVMGDGLEFLPDLDEPTSSWANASDFDTDPLGDRPVLTFEMHSGVGGTLSVAFDEENFSAVENADGTTQIIFNVYDQLVSSGFIVDGEPVLGGMIPTGGLGVDPMGSFNSDVGTRGSITYNARVRNEYVDAIGGADVNQGDTLSNNVTIEGENLDVTDLTTTRVTVSDGSGTSVEIITGNVTKELFSTSRNGVQRLAGDLDGELEVVPGDVITWKITYELPITEFEQLTISDYLPLPVFDVSEIDTSGIYAYDATDYLTGGRISFGEGDTFIGQDGVGATGDGGIDDLANYATPNAPIITLDEPNNAFTINFGDYDIPESEDPLARTIEIFVSTTITDAVYAEGLQFTNQVSTTESNSFSTTVASNEIGQIVLGVPDLTISKGVLAVDSTSGGTFTASPGPTGMPYNVTFNAPGSADAFNGTITSDGLDDQPIDADVQNLDAGDVVTFGIVVENRGSADYGAFDVQISDTVPTGFAVPGSLAALNLRVTDGNGDDIDYVISGGGTVADFFAGGIELVDPGVNTGALSEYSETSGTNLVLIAYDLVVDESAVSNETLVNTATVENFSYEDGGPNYAEIEDTDTAYVTIDRPAVVKEVLNTSHDAVSNLDEEGEVAVGEVVTYRVTIDIPEGTMPSVTISDTLPPGMAFVGVDSISFDAGLSTTKGDGDFGDVDVYYNASASTLSLGVGGSAGLGDLTNSNTDNTATEQVTFTYRAVVLNDVEIQSGVVRSNDAEISWQENGTDQLEEDSADVTVVEPNITVSKSVLGGDTTVEGADTVTYRIVVRNNDDGSGNVSEGYDVELSDILPDDVEFVSATFVSGVAPTGAVAYNGAVGNEGEITATWDTFEVGQVSRIDIVVRIDDGLPTDREILNSANVEFTSLPGDPGDVSYTGYDPATDSGSFATPDEAALANALERTGDPTDLNNEGDALGGVNDYEDENSATVTVINPIGIDKVVVDTSEFHTGVDKTEDGTVEVTIGEVVRYEVRILIPQAESTNVQLVDVLGPELQWIDSAENNLEIRLEGFNPDGSTLSAPSIPASADGTTVTFPEASAVYDETSTVTFSFGDISNTETDSEPEYLYISYNAIIKNDAEVERGDIAMNTVQLREGGEDIGSPLTQEVTIVEPDVTIAKSDNGTTSADAGDIIDYTLTITAGTSDPQLHTTAFDLSISDVLPDQLDLVDGSVTFVGLPVTSSGSITEDGGADSFSATVDRLEPGETFQITFQAEVRDTGINIIEADETVTNSATLTYSTLPDDGTDDGSGDNDTGNEAGTPGDTDGERITTKSNSDSFTSPAPVLSKVLADPADTSFTIGEPVEYVITLEISEGEVGDPNAYILDQIDPGFRFIPGTLSVTTDAGIVIGTAGTLNEANTDFFTHTDPASSSDPEQLRFDFESIIYNESSAGDGLSSGTIEIRYQLQVENIIANQQGGELNNTADFIYTDEDGSSTVTVQDSTGDSDTIITIVEPQVDAEKTFAALPALIEAGDTVSYTVTLTNPGGPLNPDQNVGAYEVIARDVVPTNLSFDGASLLADLDGADITGLVTLSANGWSIDPAANIDLAPGEVITITYDALILTPVKDGDTLTNTVDVEWSSLDNDDANDGIDGSDTGERSGNGDLDTESGAGNPNDYEEEATADLEINLTPGFDFVKEVVSTSVADTGSAAGTSTSFEDLVIGETVTYELVATLPKGTVDSVRIIDQLSLANGLLDITNVEIEAGDALRLLNGDALTTITPSQIDSATTDGYIDRVEFDFGTVINDYEIATDDASQQILIRITALVVNDVENREGDVIANTGTLLFEDDADGDGIRTEQSLQSTATVEIIEPQVDTAKRVTSVPPAYEAGVTVPYEVTLTNPGGAGNQEQNAIAYEVTARDVLPADLTLQTGTFEAILTSGGSDTDITGSFTVTAGGWLLPASADIDLGPGDVITITYDTLIEETVNDDDLLTNEVDAEWSSLDGDSAGERGGDDDFDTTGGDGPENDYESGDEVTIQADLAPTITKSVLGSTVASTANGTDTDIEDLTIGESVTYEILITMGRGTTENVRFFDQFSIDEGITGISSVTVVPGADLSIEGGGAFPTTATVTDALGGTDGFLDTIELTFGNIVNDATGAETSAEQIRILVVADLVNVEENQQGDVIENTANLFYLADPDADGDRTEESISDNAFIEVVEPQVDANKVVSSQPANPQAGDTINYTVTLTNSGGPGNLLQNVTAFDIIAQDTLPDDLELDTGSFLALHSGEGNINDQFTVSASGWITSPTADIDLDPGESVTITYSAIIAKEVKDADTLTNEVDVEWTSLDGTVTGERGGNGDLDSESPVTSPDDYEDGDDATVTVNLTPLYDFTKTIESTSQSFTNADGGTDTGIEDLVIGETVTYELIATFAKGTTDGVQIVDQLAIPNGLLDITNVELQAGAALSLGSGDPFSSLTISETNNLGADLYNDRVEINFGTVINDPDQYDGPASEQIRILITAVVVNDIENQSGDIIDNVGTFTYQGDDGGTGPIAPQTITDNVEVEIVEPEVTVAKSITTLPANPTAGETVTYQVVLSNPAPTGTENVIAFDIFARDDMPANLSLEETSFTAVLNGATDISGAFTVSSTGWSVGDGSTGPLLNQGDVVVITYDAVIQPGVQDGDNLLNEVDVEWTSIEGVDANERGGNGDLDTETPTGQPDDYEAADTADFDAEFTSAFAFTKEIVSTSEASTGTLGGLSNLTDLVVGETVTYSLTATLGRGKTDGVRFIDQFSTLNGILDITNVTINPGAALSLDSGDPFSTIIPSVTDSVGSDGYRDRIEIDFGSVVNDPDFSTGQASEQIEILVTALVVNVAENSAGDVIQNDAEFFYFDDPDSTGVQSEQSITDDVSVEILEPNLSITKSVNNDEPRLGEVLTYTLTVSNDAGASTTDAFDLVIDDLMDPRMTLDTSSVTLLILGTPSNPSAITSNNSTSNNLVLGINHLEEGESIQITYEVQVSSDTADFEAVLPNEVDLHYTSTDGVNPDERGGDPDTNDPNDPDTYTDNDDESVEVFQPDLRIEKVDYDAEIVPGGTVVYEMTVTNQGRVEALGVNVTDDISHFLEAGFTFLSGTNATLVGGIVTFDLPDMPVDDVQVVTMTLQAPDVIPAGLESITNVAVANHDDIDPTPEDNEDPEDTPVIARPDLVITKDDGLLLAFTGDEITYVITFTNVGDQVASGVVIEDVLPPEMEFISASNGGILRGNSVFWGFDEVAPGEVRTVEVTAEVIRPGLKINTVTIKDDGRSGPDPTPENNKDIDETDTEWKFRYDLTQDFRTSNGNLSLRDRHSGQSDRILRREPVIYATYMASGLAQAGSTITLEVFDETGRLIADTSVVTDAGGNWLASFPMADVDKQPARIEMRQTWASYNPAGERSYNFRTYFGPAFSTGTYYTEDLTVHSVMEKRIPSEVIDLYESSKMILAMDWNGQLYEFAARGALKSSSGN
ncbi:MAG: isopeptide-forming domain-containing fimbrial protein [Verrucomicrobiales bacterium]|nr:isopeptide-forming domain-containing fimbrial protein [Verrucomicrobiales bacterium]